MRTRDRLGMTIAPLMLRLVLGVTFLWAGAGKLVDKMPVEGERAARLANLGVNLRVAGSTPRPDPEAVPEALPEAPVEPEGDDAPPPEPETSDAEPAEGDAGDPQEQPPLGTAPVGDVAWTLAMQPAEHTAGDFPSPVEVRKLYGLALLIDSAAHPGLDEQSQQKMALWPIAFGVRPWPVYFAWAAAISEVACGALLLLGLISRLAALGTAGVMVVAMWLTQIGPAIQGGDPLLGFLPNPANPWDPAAFKDLLWQFSLLGASIAMVFSGSGALSLDRVIFGPADDGDDGEIEGTPNRRADTP